MMFSAAAISLALAVKSSQAQALSIDAAVTQAENQAFEILIQRTSVEGQKKRLQQAVAALNPRLTANTVYTRYDEQISAEFGPGQSVVIQPVESTTITLAFAYNFDIAGGTRKNALAQRKNVSVQELGLEALRNDVRLSTRTAYIAVLRAQAQVQVATQALELSKARRDQAQKQFEASVVAKVDVMRFDSQVSQAEANLAAANNALKNAKNNLNLTIARPVDTNFTAVDIPDFELTGVHPNALIVSAYGARPDLKRAETSIYAFQSVREAEEAGDDPSLTLGLNHIRNLNVAGLNPRPNQTVGSLTLSIPIFDQGITRARVQAARQDEASARIRIDQLKLTVDQEVRAALNNWETARSRLKSGLQQVRLAEEVYRISVVRRDAGEGTYVEVIDAINELTIARNNVVNSRFDALQALFQLQRAVGNDDILQRQDSTPSQPAKTNSTQGTK